MIVRGSLAGFAQLHIDPQMRHGMRERARTVPRSARAQMRIRDAPQEYQEIEAFVGM